MAYTIYEGPTGRERLLQTFENTIPAHFEDLLYCCAVTLEDALLKAGMEPHKDYQKMDLFTIAMPMAIEYSKKYNAAITTGIPDSHPHSGVNKKEYRYVRKLVEGEKVWEKTYITS